jgi:phage terminase large subunit
LTTKDIYLPDIVGKGYKTFWNFKGRYRVVKGSRASKKSKTAALWFIYNLMKYPGSNLLVIRKTYRTLKDSCFTDLQWACARLSVSHLWEFKQSPLEATYKPTGQKILFRGLDDPLKITSITVPTGALCWGWIEESFEISRETDFETLNESIRGQLPNGLWKQWTLTLNPWNESHWIKKRFFDSTDENTLAMTTNYMCNEWLDEADIRLFEEMKQKNPRRYQVAGLGNWGIVDGLVYENWEERAFSMEEVRECTTVCGLDFGFTNDPTALFVGFADVHHRLLYVWDEMYKKALTNKAIVKEVEKMGYSKEKITADSAEQKSIRELYDLGLRIKPAKKGPDSIRAGIQYLQNYRIVVHPRCVNFLSEISNYQWDKDKFGNSVNKPIDDFNHLMDAMRYAMEDFTRTKAKLNRLEGRYDF